LLSALAARIIAGTVLLVAAPLVAQRTPDLSMTQLDPSTPSMHGRRNTEFDPSVDISRDARRLNLLNEMRQKSMKDDAAKLLRLAQELNAAISKNGPALSPEERLHRIAEIEKLAKQVKSKMSYANAPVPDKLPDVVSHWP
jgi:ribosomal protein S7